MNSWRFAGTLLGLAALLVCEAAWAQKAVILDFEDDRRDRVRVQIVRELSREGGVEFVPLAEFKRIAAGKGFSGARAMTPEAVAEVAKELPFSAALAGSVGRKGFRFRILDARGTELFAREVPLSRGRLSTKNARRIAAAVIAAAKTKPKPPEPPLAPEPAPIAEAPAVEASEVRPASAERDVSDPHTTVGVPEDAFDAPQRSATAAPAVGPKLLTLRLGGTTTWRAYCSRPGVGACRDYDAMAEGDRPAGDTVDFSPRVPYAGFGLGIDFFPLWSMDNLAKGFGLTAGFSRGFSLTNVRVQTLGGGESPEKQVISIDDAWHALATWRFYFEMGAREPLSAYIGVRGGLSARTFEVDPDAAVPLPGSHRSFPSVGVDVSIPLAKLIRVEAAGTWFFNPRAGIDEIAGYGADATGFGWSAEAGLAGDIWGPIGYELRFRLISFKDQFTGAGNKWAEGGAAEETYSGLNWGLTASF